MRNPYGPGPFAPRSEDDFGRLIERRNPTEADDWHDDHCQDEDGR